MLLISGDGDGFHDNALRRSEGLFGAGLMAGIRNADPVLADLQGICKRLLILEVLMLILFWEFTSSLLETVLFLMVQQGTPHKGVS